MATIKKSVGKGGKNEEDDVRAVQELLNKFTSLGGYSKVAEDGKIGSKTLAAIGAFQQKVVGMSRPDQRVDPGGATLKKLNESPGTVAKEAKEAEKAAEEEEAAADAGGGKVTGQTSGVGADILTFLEAVANYYGKEIKVTSGLRDKKKQADVMWEYWTKTLDRGRIYSALKSNETLRKKLDEYWEKKDAASEAAFKTEIQKIAGSLSLHLSGRAVDVTTSVDKKVFEVLKANMHFVHEKNTEGQTTCYHFDSKKTLPAVTDSMKAGWPAK